MHFLITKESCGQRKNSQLNLIKVNENKCVIKGKYPRQMIAYQMTGGDGIYSFLPYLSFLKYM